MTGRIRRDDLDALRERARIDEVVGHYVTLKPAGVGSLKGLCPFHDERTPSFHVRPPVGLWHCFGCNEGGDVISFAQKIDHLAFQEAVESLATRYGITLRYEDGGPGKSGEEPGRRRRLLEANRVSAEYFASQLGSAEAEIGRSFLKERGFDTEVARHFGIGYAPRGWDHLLKHLRSKGFTEPELTASGLVSQGNRGVYDRFRGRLIWPIRDLPGEVIGFGARRLHDDDHGPKYLNTPETAVFKKSQVLYGVDLAKREIARRKQVVVVEGYTDVMAAHLAGVETTVATCGTAFGADHVRIVRRLLGDGFGASSGVQLSSGVSIGGEVVFTFDGDEAGQKAALRAFGEDQKFYAQTFVAVDSNGMDPCDLRIQRGDAAVRDLVGGRVPLFEFAIRSVLAQYDLDTAEGRVTGLRTSAPIIARIRDHALRPEYARMLAGWLGMDVDSVRAAVARAGRAPQPRSDVADRTRPASASSEPPPQPSADPLGQLVRHDPVARLEGEVLEVVLQLPHYVPAEFDELGADAFTVPAFRVVHDAIRASGGVRALAGADGGSVDVRSVASWLENVVEAAPPEVGGLLTELAVAPLPQDQQDGLASYAVGMVNRIIGLGLTRSIADVRGRLERMDPGASGDEYNALFSELIKLEERRRSLREED